MKVFNVGKDECILEFVDAEDFIFIVYDYEEGSYEGSGDAVGLHKDGNLYWGNLAHCSCFGPGGNFGSGEKLKSDSPLLFDNVIDAPSSKIEEKVRELLYLMVGEEI